MLRKFNIKIDGVTYLVEMEELGVDNQSIVAPVTQPTSPTTVKEATPPPVEMPQPVSTGQGEPVKAPMPGKILKILVSVGDTVVENQPLLILEAMKMENEIVASKAGVVAAVNIAENQNVDSGDLLLEIS